MVSTGHRRAGGRTNVIYSKFYEITNGLLLHRSKFELPPNTKNRYLYYDEWEVAKARQGEAKTRQKLACVVFGEFTPFKSSILFGHLLCCMSHRNFCLRLPVFLDIKKTAAAHRWDGEK